VEEESRERGRRRAAGCVGKWDEEDAQPAAQAAAHATLCLLALLRRRHGRVGAQGSDAGVGEGEEGSHARRWGSSSPLRFGLKDLCSLVGFGVLACLNGLFGSLEPVGPKSSWSVIYSSLSKCYVYDR
jgi:hypothetical protein